MSFEITILGNNSAIHAHGRHPTSQVLNIHDKLYLIDCGEGTQMQMSYYKIKKSRIDHIFISHLHGDHFFGLIGLLTSYHLLRRANPLHIYGPKGLDEIINIQLSFSETKPVYEMIFHEVNCKEPEVIYETPELTVTTFPVMHRIPTAGFLFQERNELRKVLIEKVNEYNIPHTYIGELKKGKDYSDNGEIVANDLVTTAPAPPRGYAFCADTLYTESIVRYIKGYDLVYHEATFMEDSAERAKITFHSTAKQAGTIAKKAGIKRLLIGHFSAKYENLLPLLNEAREIFQNTELALEGKRFEIEKKELQK